MYNRFQMLVDMNPGDELAWFVRRGAYKNTPVKCVWRRREDGFTFIMYVIKVDEHGIWVDNEYAVQTVFSTKVDECEWDKLRHWYNPKKMIQVVVEYGESMSEEDCAIFDTALAQAVKAVHGNWYAEHMANDDDAVSRAIADCKRSENDDDE